MDLQEYIDKVFNIISPLADVFPSKIGTWQRYVFGAAKSYSQILFY